MTTDTGTQGSVTGAVAQQDNSPNALIERYSKDYALVLPSHVKAETWVRLAQGALRRDDNLRRVAERNPASLLSALLECARKGLEPGTEEFYLVPFGNEVTGITGYQGEVELIYRAGAVASVKAEVVRAHDTFTYDPARDDRPDHKVHDWFGDRGELIGVYAYAVMKDGSTSKVIVLGKPYIDKVKTMSRGSDKASSPWQKWEEAMWLKTAVHQLHKWVPTSAEYRREMLRTTAEATDRTASIAGGAPTEPLPEGVNGDGEIVDAEIVDSPPPSDDGSWPAVSEPGTAQEPLGS